MNELPDLDRLSHAEKDELIRALFAQVQALTKQLELLTAKVVELEGRLAKNSRNSSRPPSSDGLNRPKPKSQRKSGQKPNGGQKGHTGHTLKQVAEVDHIEAHAPPAQCDACGSPLADAVVVETRQVFDIPPLRHEVTEHQILEAVCACGKTHRGAFPADVSAPVQYGPRLKAAVVQLTHHHMMPVSRTGDLLGDLFGLPLSDATVLAINAEAGTLLTPVVTAMGEALNLIDRLRIHADDVWRFATDHRVLFSNNITERAVSMPKVKQKISGGFRTQTGLESFCTIRSYLATLHKQGINLFHSLTRHSKATSLCLDSLDLQIIIPSDYLSSYLGLLKLVADS